MESKVAAQSKLPQHASANSKAQKCEHCPTTANRVPLLQRPGMTRDTPTRTPAEPGRFPPEFNRDRILCLQHVLSRGDCCDCSRFSGSFLLR